MTGIEYLERRDLHPFWDESRDPNREDVAEAYEQGKADGYNEGYDAGATWADENPKQVWHDAQGEYLPEYDREVIAICGANGQICFAHRPNPKGWFGKSLTTGKASHYEPKTYGVGGWNLEDVVFWLDVEIPYDQIEARLDMM